MKNKHTCIVCGFINLEQVPIYPFSSHEICSCCGTEYGLDVQRIEDVELVRQEWLDEGAPWFYDDADRPDGWNMSTAIFQIEQNLGITITVVKVDRGGMV